MKILKVRHSQIAIFLCIVVIGIITSCANGSRKDLEQMQKGKEYFFKKDYLKAQKLFNKSLKSNPRNDVSIAYSGFCSYYLGNYSQALIQYNRSLKINGSNNIALFGKSLVLWKMENYLGAYILFDSVSNINPKHDKVFYYKALAELEFGDTLSAMQNLNKAIINASNYSDPYYLKSSIFLKKGQSNKADSLLKLAQKNKTEISNSP